MITTKTLENTAQLCSLAVEMENRESPRQHRKKQLLPLHPNRLLGRTDSNTFFSSIQSIRGYKCVQLFYYLLSCYTYISYMRRESNSHQAYQDFIRDIGALVGCAQCDATPLKRTIGRRGNIGHQQTTSKALHPGKTDSHAHQR